jgi:hypothetical protein
VKRAGALVLVVLGYSLIAALEPTVAVLPALAAFLGAGALLLQSARPDTA